MADSVTAMRLVLIGCCGWLAACAVGPDYRRPDTAAATTPAYKASTDRAWKLAEPGDEHGAARWWEGFEDPQLGQLLEEVAVSNQNLAQAEARYRQAVALLGSARAGFFPKLDANSSYTRRNGGGGDSQFSDQDFRSTRSQYDLGINLNWELDLWGRLRRQLEASRADVQASSAELAGARLSAQSTLAQSYFQLRALDEQKRLYEQTLAAFQRSLELTENQYRAGLVARSDVVLAQTQLENTRAQAIDLDSRRAQLENAIAVLTGKAPAAFDLAPLTFTAAPPTVPLALPSTLLERRPDIAAAERQVMAANARIGVARAAYFPNLTLSGAGGYQSGQFADWLDAPNRFWSLGPALALTLFDGGARSAQQRQAEATYDESVARYRQTVLDSLREVEDALARLRVLEREIAVQRRAVTLAEEAERLVLNQYRAGTISYLDVATAQRQTLDGRRSVLNLVSEQFTASVQLMAALGGDWSAVQLDNPVISAEQDRDAAAQ